MAEDILLLLLLVVSNCFQLILSDGLVYKTAGPFSFLLANKVPDSEKVTTDFIEANGYVAETHDITTADKYILTLHRIPKGKTGSNEAGSKPVVIFGHGIFSSSDTWLLSGAKSFPYVLADAGYDVWLPNLRGNLYSYRHAQMTSEDRRFWDFGFHETAIYDLAAIIDHVIEKTGVQKVFYIGHSRGTTIAYILCSEKPEYNEKIKFMVSLSPIAYLRHSRSPVMRVLTDTVSATHISYLSWALSLTGIGPIEFGLTNLKILPTFCNLGQITQILCLHGFSMVNGYSDNNFEKERLAQYLNHFPNNASEREITHYLQIARTDNFENFDYGRLQNLIQYGALTPPQYNLSKITIPIVFYYGSNDYFNSLEDINHLISQIRNNKGVFKIQTYNHLDYIWGKNANEVLYQHAIKLMNEYKDKRDEFDLNDKDLEEQEDDDGDVGVSQKNAQEDKPKFETDYVNEKSEPATVMPAVVQVGDKEDTTNQAPGIGEDKGKFLR